MSTETVQQWNLDKALALQLFHFVLAVAGAGKVGNGSSVGSAQVFVPNPVQSLGDESLTDQKDSDAAVPAAAYHAVQLTNLDGSGFLRGPSAVGTVGPSQGSSCQSPRTQRCSRRAYAWYRAGKSSNSSMSDTSPHRA